MSATRRAYILDSSLMAIASGRLVGRAAPGCCAAEMPSPAWQVVRGYASGPPRLRDRKKLFRSARL
jgi:hypothetical protein